MNAEISESTKLLTLDEDENPSCVFEDLGDQGMFRSSAKR